MTVSATQMPICLSNSKERGRGHVVTIQNKVIVFGAQLSSCSVLVQQERKSCQILVHWALDVSSRPKHLSRIKLHFSQVLWNFGGVSKDVNGDPRNKRQVRKLGHQGPLLVACWINVSCKL